MQHNWTHRIIACAAACAAACLSAGPAVAQIIVNHTTDANGVVGGQVNISGATLFADFFEFPAAFNDHLNVDGDAYHRPGPCNDTVPDAGFYDANCDGGRDRVDWLTVDTVPGTPTTGLPPVPVCGVPYTSYILFQYRSVGSVNGFREFVDFQLLGTIPNSIPTERGIINTIRWANLGAHTTTYAACRADCNGNGIADDSGTPVCPVSVDLANLDVESRWAVRAGDVSQEAWNRTPTALGYGYNSRTSTTGYSNNLETLERGALSLNQNVGSADADTIFDTTIAFSPVDPIANRGVGINCGNVTYSELQHHFVTGRMPSGENLVAVTRDIGSGTRNAFYNPLGIDPSHGVGDNVGNEIADQTLTRLGPLFQPTNCGGSGFVENVVQSHRLALGYTGHFGPSRAVDDSRAGRYEIMNLRKDIAPFFGTQYVRPDVNTILDNADWNTGYQIGGLQSLVSRGDPTANGQRIDPNGPNYNPIAMENIHARNFIRNILYSVSQYSSNPPGNLEVNMPAEILTRIFVVDAAVDHVPDPLNPVTFIPNPRFNQSVQDDVRLNNPTDPFSFGAVNSAGLVPVRLTLTGGATYSDGSNGPYRNFSGAAIVGAGVRLSERNRIAGDFHYDGRRNVCDIPRLVQAMLDPRGFVTAEGKFTAGNAGDILDGNYVIPEIIGDFNGDGNFDKEDLRYFGDGLAIDPSTRQLARYLGFKRIDEALAADGQTPETFWPATLATGKPYQAGDVAGDIAGSAVGPSAGWKPTGHDGVVDAKDIDYVLRNFGNWADLHQAEHMDLSCDFTDGDPVCATDLPESTATFPDCDPNNQLEPVVPTLVIDQADVDVLVRDILGTRCGDANLDGRVDAADEAIVLTNLNIQPPSGGWGWADGDFDGDGYVTMSDYDCLTANCGFVGAWLGFDRADIDLSGGSADATDRRIFVNVLLGLDTECVHVNRSDLNEDGRVDGDDVQLFVNEIF
ncbi:MAG: hypothetical protein HUU22_16095 [Phycisphaerae bacterium]|nr:dockerin type I repeat-containing protein [Phycisphaerae bacterium]NUQ47542.1 hypothetical protein [Phycisphaerae bacterium]